VYVSFGKNEWNWWNWDEEGVIRNWSHDVWYVMNTNGKITRTDKVEEDSDSNNNSDDHNEAIENFRKSKEEIKKQREQKLRELNEIDKQLNQQEKTDSTKYHYQPEKSKKQQPKPQLCFHQKS